jgi:hypothetical protein
LRALSARKSPEAAAVEAARPTIQYVPLQVALPSEGARDMFHSLLALVPEGASRAETAEILARWLPTGFAGIGPYLPDPSANAPTVPEFRPPAAPQTITHRHERSTPHTTNRTPTRTPRHKPNLSRTHSASPQFVHIMFHLTQYEAVGKGKNPKNVNHCEEPSPTPGPAPAPDQTGGSWHEADLLETAWSPADGESTSLLRRMGPLPMQLIQSRQLS